MTGRRETSGMKIYNTLSKSIEDIVPINTGKIAMYSCGPTVYSEVHIGNLASFIYADTLRRALSHAGYQVKHVMNYTDVDDKTINRSRERYPDLPPKKALKQLTESYIDLFMTDLAAVGNDIKAYHFTKATNNIENIKRLITELVNNDFAYLADDGIYFSIENYIKSGKVYGQLSEITAGSTSSARINNDEYDKASVHDFALWKKQKAGEPAWSFKIKGQDLAGRPGWHIECSVMSRTNLGQPFDIHTGGVDLIFPHHENEIAQSTACQTDPIYAKYFFHNEHLLVNNQKMSKSLNNFITLKDVIKRGIDPLAFRLLILQSHYTSQGHFSWENLEAAENRLYDLKAMAALKWQPRAVAHDAGTFAMEDVTPSLTDSINDNLNTPQALAFLSSVSDQLRAVHIEEDMVDHMDKMLSELDDLFGLNLAMTPDITVKQKDLIKLREEARINQDWAKADSVRDALKQQKIGLDDAAHGTIWYPLK